MSDKDRFHVQRVDTGEVLGRYITDAEQAVHDACHYANTLGVAMLATEKRSGTWFTIERIDPLPS